MIDRVTPSGPGGGRIVRWTKEVLTASRFAIVGGAATVVHMLVVWQLAHGFGVPVFRANVIAFLCAFVVSFSGHHWWTFRGSGPVGRRLLRFTAIAVAGFGVNSIVLAAVLRTEILSPAASALVAVATVPVLTFIASRLWGFSTS